MTYRTCPLFRWWAAVTTDWWVSGTSWLGRRSCSSSPPVRRGWRWQPWLLTGPKDDSSPEAWTAPSNCGTLTMEPVSGSCPSSTTQRYSTGGTLKTAQMLLQSSIAINLYLLNDYTFHFKYPSAQLLVICKFWEETCGQLNFPLVFPLRVPWI